MGEITFIGQILKKNHYLGPDHDNHHHQQQQQQENWIVLPFVLQNS